MNINRRELLKYSGSLSLFPLLPKLPEIEQAENIVLDKILLKSTYKSNNLTNEIVITGYNKTNNKRYIIEYLNNFKECIIDNKKSENMIEFYSKNSQVDLYNFVDNYYSKIDKIILNCYNNSKIVLKNLKFVKITYNNENFSR